MTTIPDFHCVVNADLFRRVMLAQSMEATRYYLHGVFVEPHPDGGAILTATNGHILISLHDPRAVVQGTGIVSLDKRVAAALKGSTKADTGHLGRTCERVLVVKSRGTATNSLAWVSLVSRTAEQTADQASYQEEAEQLLEDFDFRTLAAQFWNAVIDGTFPDYRKVANQNYGGACAQWPIDGQKLATIADAFAPSGIKVRFTVEAPSNHAAIITPTALINGLRVNAIALVMPLRPDPDPVADFGAWIRPTVPQSDLV